MAAKTWETDFRFAAIQASIARLDHDPDRPWKAEFSYCLPVGDKPVVGWTPGRIALAILGLGFLMLLTSVLVSAGIEAGDIPDPGHIPSALCVICGISGIGAFLVPLVMDKKIVALIVGDRGRALVSGFPHHPLRCAEISDGASDHKITIDGDDYALISFDALNKRIIIEGVAARYQIRKQDIVLMAPFEFMGHLGADITYRVDVDTCLRLAIARSSLALEFIRQAPVFYFLRGKIRNKLLLAFQETLGITDLIYQSQIDTYEQHPK